VPALHRIDRSILQTRLSPAAEPPNNEVLYSNGDKAPSEEMLSEFLEMIGSVAMVRDINEPIVYLD
jgi:hypothetical protein